MISELFPNSCDSWRCQAPPGWGQVTKPQLDEVASCPLPSLPTLSWTCPSCLILQLFKESLKCLISSKNKNISENLRCSWPSLPTPPGNTCQPLRFYASSNICISQLNYQTPGYLMVFWGLFTTQQLLELCKCASSSRIFQKPPSPPVFKSLETGK